MTARSSVPRPPTSRLLAAVTLVGIVTLAALTPVAAQAAPFAPGSTSSVGACRAAQTKVVFRPTDGAAGSFYGRMVVVNTSSRTCTLHGYGGISLVGRGNGTQIGAASVRMPSRVRTLTLAPGQRARARVQVTDALNYPKRTCQPRRVQGFRVYLPGETHAQFAPYGTTGCANPAVKLVHNWAYGR